MDFQASVTLTLGICFVSPFVQQRSNYLKTTALLNSENTTTLPVILGKKKSYSIFYISKRARP